MKLFFLAAVLGVFPSLAADQILLRYLDIGDGGLGLALASDPSGNLFAVTEVTDASGVPHTRVIKTDPNGTQLASFDFGSMFQIAATTDARGNLLLAGSAEQQGFPLSSPSSGPVTGLAAFVLKLDSQLHGIVFSKLLPAPSQAFAIALDTSGNIFVGGGTSAQDFPITPGAFQSTPPPAPTDFGSTAYAFLTELSADGSTILYSTFFGGNGVNCYGGSSCIGAFAGTSITAIALDASGAVVVAGPTTTSDLPVTPGALAGSCGCSNTAGAGFVAKFSPKGSPQLIWSTFLNASVEVAAPEFMTINAIALDSTGNVIVGGETPVAFPTTPGVVQPALPNSVGFNAGFAAKVNNSGTSLIWSTYFGSYYGAGVSGLALDPQGNVVITGYSDPSLLPGLSSQPSTFGSYTARLSPDAATLLDLFVGPNLASGRALALGAAGTFVTVGQSGSLWIESSSSGGSLLEVGNAASGPVSGLVAPSELISLYGVGIGPAAPLGGQVKSGAFTTSLGGYHVLFDGNAAPLLYAGPSQINAIVPSGVALEDSTHIQIVSPSGTIDGPTLYVRPTEPSVFESGTYSDDLEVLAAALNQDGTPNSAQNPAVPGSIVTIFATGTGASLWPDGMIVPIGSYQMPLRLPISIVGGDMSLEVLYAGDAPGLVAGVMQINFRLPAVLPPKLYGLQLEAGSALANGFIIAVP
jgi:uncharacterized protein (TIGR03437 family)